MVLYENVYYTVFDSNWKMFFFQKDLPDVMRQGMDEIIRFDKKPEEKIRVYTYENAAKRWNTYVLLKINVQYLRLKGH